MLEIFQITICQLVSYLAFSFFLGWNPWFWPIDVLVVMIRNNQSWQHIRNQLINLVSIEKTRSVSCLYCITVEGREGVAWDPYCMRVSRHLSRGVLGIASGAGDRVWYQLLAHRHGEHQSYSLRRMTVRWGCALTTASLTTLRWIVNIRYRGLMIYSTSCRVRKSSRR